MIGFAVDQHDTVRLRKALPERVRGCDTSDATAENENGLRVSHGLPLLP